MTWLAELIETCETTEYDSNHPIYKNVDRSWIDEALSATKTATLRRRRLPAEQVVWLVLGMALMRKRSISEVAAKLDIALPARGSGVSTAPSALVQARQRVGAEPIEYLFRRTAEVWGDCGESEKWRGLSVYGIDGSHLAVSDSEENSQHFGRHRSGKNATESAYPMVRVVVLLNLVNRVLASASFGPYQTGELSLAKTLLDEVPEDSIVVLDRLYSGSPQLLPVLKGRNRHFLVKLKKSQRPRLLEVLGPGDQLVEIATSDEARRTSPDFPATYRARAITYRTKKNEYVLLTSLLDAEKYPASEVIALYRDRWECELAYGEIKTDLLEQQASLRSRTVVGVEQELWGVLLAYNLVRREMAQFAAQADVPVTRVSFSGALWQIRDEWLWCAVASPGAIPRHLRNLREDLKRFILPPRRKRRSYPRVVKRKDSPYPRKRSKSLRNPPN